MKYAIVIPAGAPDQPVEELEGRTPWQAADVPSLDRLAATGRIGTAVTIPSGRPASAEVGVLSVLGYDPLTYPMARGPLEALARGMELGPADQVFRCNLVTITDGVMTDFSAGYIDSAQAEPLIDALNDALEDRLVGFHCGRSYRNLFVWRDAGPLADLVTTGAQGILDQPIKKHLPRGEGAKSLRQLIDWSQGLLAGHDVNHVRRDLGEVPANGIWVYGQGPLPALPDFAGRFGPRGAVVAGVDVVRGLARQIGWEVVPAVGATGLLDTDFAAKGAAACAALDRCDLVCVHVEAPDEAGHLGDAPRKVRTLEAIDQHIVSPLVERLESEPEHRVLVMPDHATPLARRRHTADDVCFVIAGTGIESNRGAAFDERSAAGGELHLEQACDLMEYFLRR